MITKIQEITPALAESLMKKNTSNRKLNRKTVDMYASDMRSGKWRLTHQGIAFGCDGRLIDGQHRLAAIIESGATVQMQVSYSADAYGIDAHKARSLKDQIILSGASDWVTARALQVSKAWLAAIRPSTKHSTAELLDFTEAHKEAIQFAEAIFGHRAKVSQAPIRAAVAMAFAHIQKDALARFVEVLESGLPDSQAEHAAIKLREYAFTVAHPDAGARAKLTRVAQHAISKFADGAPIKRLSTPTELIYT